MIIELNTELKTIIIKDACLVKDIIEFCKKKKIDINEYTIVSDVQYNYSYPYTITFPDYEFKGLDYDNDILN